MMRKQINRRAFLQKSSAVAAVATLASMNVPHVFAAEDNTIRLALIGCGGRGRGALAHALATTAGPVKLVAMADVFEGRVKSGHANLLESSKEKLDVTPERMFIGFDAYQKAMDALKPHDIAILTTPPAFRWVHFKHAIERNLNVFMEKPVTVDGPSTRRMLDLADESLDK